MRLQGTAEKEMVGPTSHPRPPSATWQCQRTAPTSSASTARAAQHQDKVRAGGQPTLRGKYEQMRTVEWPTVLACPLQGSLLPTAFSRGAMFQI